jgi:hypothetical protein
VGELRSAIEAEAGVDLDDLDNAALGASIVELIGERDRLSAVIARRLAVHDTRGAWKADGRTRRRNGWPSGPA